MNLRKFTLLILFVLSLSVIINVFAAKEDLNNDFNKNIKKAREDTSRLREAQEKIKEQLTDLKNALYSCKGSKEERCVKAHKEAKLLVREFLINSLMNEIFLLEKTKNKLEDSDLNEDERKDALEDINNKIAEINILKIKVNDLKDISQEKDVDALVANTRLYLKETRQIIRKTAGRLAQYKLETVINKLSQLETKLDKANASLEIKDEKEWNQLLDAFKVSLEKSKLFQQRAKDILITQKEILDDKDVREATTYLSLSHQKIVEAHENLKEIGLFLRSNGLKLEAMK